MAIFCVRQSIVSLYEHIQIVRGGALVALSRFREARVALEECLKFHLSADEDRRVLSNLGICYEKLGYRDRGKQAFLEALRKGLEGQRQLRPGRQERPGRPARGLPGRGQLRGQGPVLAYGAAAARTGAGRARVDHDIKVYPDAGHAFLHQPGSQPGTVAGFLARITHAGYHEPSARDARRRIVAFFDAHLKT